MKKIISFLLTVVLLTACYYKPLKNSEELKIVITSDIHYFLKDYYQDCEWFEESMLYGDGKMVTYADEILDAFVKTIENIHPDLVVLTGDLSFNGEIGSHKGLAQKLQPLKEKGIHVAVIPGNHDVDNIYSKGYGKDDYFKVDNVDAKEFKTIYKDLGYDIAYHQHKESLSYSIQLNDDYTFLMMDSTAHQLTGSTLDTGGYFTESTISWMKKELTEIQKDNKIPIIAMHHNLINHNSILNQGYTIRNHEEIIQILKDFSVPFVLSGHIHCQNIKEQNGIYDIASSSLLDAPLQYGIMILNQKGMNYQTQSLKISVDANKYFDLVANNRFLEEFKKVKDEKIRKEMKDVLVKTHRYYFAGCIDQHIDEIKKMKGYQYYNQEEGKNASFYKNYLESMLSDKDNNCTLNIVY